MDSTVDSRKASTYQKEKKAKAKSGSGDKNDESKKNNSDGKKCHRCGRNPHEEGTECKRKNWKP